MSGRVKRALKREEGQALVEFALVMPILLLMILGIIDFGRAINYWNSETSLANVAARYVSVGTLPTTGPCPNEGTISAYMTCALTNQYGITTVTGSANGLVGPTYCVSVPTDSSGQPVAVSSAAPTTGFRSSSSRPRPRSPAARRCRSRTRSRRTCTRGRRVADAPTDRQQPSRRAATQRARRRARDRDPVDGRPARRRLYALDTAIWSSTRATCRPRPMRRRSPESSSCSSHASRRPPIRTSRRDQHL